MKKLGLTTKILIGFILGILLGIVFKEQVLIIKPIGDIFLTLVKMIVVPLVFFSITSGVASIGDIKRLTKIGSKTILYFIVTTAVAGVVGCIISNVLQPGAGVDLSGIVAGGSVKAKQMPTLGATILGMFPSNPIASMAKGSLMQIIIFSLFLGVSFTMLGEKGKRIIGVFDDMAKAMYKMTSIVMEFSPYGVAALMAASIGRYGLSIFSPLGKFIGSIWIADILVAVLMYGIMLKFIGKIPLSGVIKRISNVWMMTLSTTSSSGTLPVTIGTAEKKFGVSEKLAEFILPLGATMNMNGGGVYYSVAVLFVAQIYGVQIDFTQQLLLIALATVISVGSPGIPGSGIVMTIMLLGTMGLPLDIMGVVAGMYRLIDMANTTMNVTGDVVTSVCIARGENEIDDSVYAVK